MSRYPLKYNSNQHVMILLVPGSR